MTRLDDRRQDSGWFARRRATEDTRRKVAGWETQCVEGPTFCIHYENTVSFLIHQGAAELTFADGETVDLQAGDFLTIERGARADWNLSETVQISFLRHDSVLSASNRVPLVRWRND